MFSSTLLMTCNSSTQNPAPVIKGDTVESIVSDELMELDTLPKEDLGFHEREPNDDEIREYGLITDLEDAAYPLFTVTVSFPERKMENQFYLDESKAELNPPNSGDFINKYATLYYVIETSSDLMDIQLNGESLLGQYAPEVDSEWFETEGFIRNATAPTTSDLPGELILELGIDKFMSFGYYLTEEIVAANNKKVKVFYQEREREKITYMELAED